MRPADYHLMLEYQQGRCAICKELPIKGERLNIDHDHLTGEVRGLLCGLCNRGLGLFKDKPEILDSASSYLKARGDSSRFFVEGGRLTELSND